MGRIETVQVDDLGAGGDGIARVNGKVCFVPLGVPGDRLRIRITKEKSKLLRGEIVEVLCSSPHRRQPVCPHFGQCGGCQWLHVDEKLQIETKIQMLKRALGLDRIDFDPSAHALGYRRTARLHWVPRKKAPALLGFARARSHQVVDVEACPILTPELSDCLGFLRRRLLSTVDTRAEVRLAQGDNGIVAAIVSDFELTRAFYASAQKWSFEGIAGVVVSTEGYESTVAGTKDVIIEGGDGQPLTTPATGFGQANRRVNRALGETVAGWLDRRDYKNALELFAGAGNLTSVLARRVRRVKAVEIDPDACAALRKNMDARGLRGVTVCPGNALDAYLEERGPVDLVVLDPPRAGDLDLARALARGEHRALLYVSCDPATLSRDLAELGRGGYRIAEAIGFDMFPNTAHIESAVLLER